MSALGAAGGDRDFLVTCEHGGNRIPARFRAHVSDEELASHRGYDAGALTVARQLARQLGAPLLHSTISRLLVDLNRSPGHPRLYGEAIRRLPAETRQRIWQTYYQPFRSKVEDAIGNLVARGRHVIHISCHSFTPMLDGVARRADIGLLYDPSRYGEAALCQDWHARLAARRPDCRVRRNYPYRGTSDGFTAYLRGRFAATEYIGIELEINQRFPLAGGRTWTKLRRDIVLSLVGAVDAFFWP